MAKRTSRGRTVARRPKPTKLSPMQTSMIDAAGAGNEEITQRDLMIPFLRLLQDLNPQVKKRDEAHVAGAESGMYYETVTQELWSGEDGILVIPCHYQFMVNEWVKRKHGGGFVASHPNMAAAIENCVDSEKHDLVDTHQHAVLIQYEDGSWGEAIFPLKSTGIKASKHLNSMVTGKTDSFIDQDGEEQTYELPRFHAIWRFTSMERSNEKGDFFVPKSPVKEMDLMDMGDEGEALFQRAFRFYQQCAAGEASIDYRKAGDEIESDEDSDEPPF